MRIDVLDMHAFGPFTDARLSFEGTAPGAIDLIVGRNGAGKSTARRSVEGVLFGIPRNTRDAHRHAPDRLRVAARLSRPDGEQLAVVRRKGTKSTLTTPDGTPVDENRLVAFMRGLDRDLFASMFSFSREALEQGGRDLLAGKGTLSESLFGAALGLGRIHELLHELEEEAAALYTHGGSVRQLNAALSEYKDLRGHIRRAAADPAAHARVTADLQAARATRDGICAEHESARTELGRLERLERVLGSLAAWRGTVRELEALGDVPQIDPDAGERRRRAVESLDRARRQEEDAQRSIDQIGAELAALPAGDDVRAFRSDIGLLAGRIGEITKAREDLPRRAAERDMRLRAANEAFAQVRTGLDVEGGRALRPTAAQRTRLNELISDHGARSARLAAARQARVDAAAELDAAETALTQLPAPPDDGELRLQVDVAVAAGDLDERIDDARSESTVAAREVRQKLNQLPAWDRPVDELVASEVPGEHVLAEFEARRQDLSLAERELADRRRKHAEAHDAMHLRRRNLEQGGAPPTKSELLERRRARDERFDDLRTAWAEAPGGAPQIEADYTEMVATADEVSDQLRDEADRVAAAERLELEAEQLDLDARRIAERELELEEERAASDADWRAAWQAVTAEPGTVAAMRGWLGKRDAVVAAAEQARRAQTAYEKAAARRTALRDALAGAASGLRAPAPGEDEELRPVLARASRILERIDVQSRAVADAEQRLEAARKALDRATREEADASSEEGGWRGEWARALEPLGLPAATRVRECQAILDALADAFTHLDSADVLDERVEKMQADIADFECAARRLAARAAPELDAPTPIDLVAALNRRLKDAETSALTREGLEPRLEEANQALETERQNAADARGQLDALAAAAGVDSVAELPAVEERAERRRSLSAKRDELEERIAEVGGDTADVLAEVLDGETAESLRVKREAAARIVHELADKLEAATERVVSERRVLEAMDGSAEAAELSERAESTLARIRGAAERYVELRLAICILRAAMDRHRDEHQGPLLERAGELFDELTRGELTRLLATVDGGPTPVLRAIDRDGAEIPVDGLSDGQRDQLFLALRVASLEQYFEHAEPVPIVVDDAFINFDDPSTAAGLRLLAGLAERTQVLFFTHHDHVVKLAEAALAPAQLAVRRLDWRDRASSVVRAA